MVLHIIKYGFFSVSTRPSLLMFKGIYDHYCAVFMSAYQQLVLYIEQCLHTNAHYCLALPELFVILQTTNIYQTIELCLDHIQSLMKQ